MRNLTIGTFAGGACALFCALALLVPDARAGNTRVIFSFGGSQYGGYPDTDLVLDAAGNVYGMAVQGGAFGGGTVYELSHGGAGWTQNVLHNFTGGPDGGQPYGGVTLDAQGNVFGTAVIGGNGGFCTEDGCGVVFELIKTGDTWNETVIHNFAGGEDGYGPGGPVVFDDQGNLFGMTPTGGTYGLGIIFELSPQPDGSWKETIVHPFTGGEDGGAASAGRLLIVGGNIYGVATVGGTYGAGTAFELTPSPTGWDFKTLYAFQGQPDAGFPYGGLARDANGDLYGTTYYDGADDLGCVYRLHDTGSGWTETVLHSFSGGRDGSGSISGIVFDAKGNLYCTTSEGGAAGSYGAIIKLAPQPGGAWKESVAYRFKGSPDGAYAYAGLVSDGAGGFFGATVKGGDDDDGAIYHFAP